MTSPPRWYPALPALLLVACLPSGAIPSPGVVGTPSGPAPTVLAAPCPDPGETPASGEGYALPDGASWARICGTSNEGTGGSGGDEYADRVLLGPPDALVTNLAGLIEFANALPQATDQPCTTDLGPAYTLVVGYPDGTTQQITGQLYGCGSFGDRIGAQALLTDFGNRLRAQRDAYPGLAPVLGPCADERSVLGDLFVQPNLGQTTAAYVMSHGAQDDQPVLREVVEWPALLAAMLAESEPHGAEADPSAGTVGHAEGLPIEAVNPQCEALTLNLTADGISWQQPGDPETMIWRPDAAAHEILQPYLDWAEEDG